MIDTSINIVDDEMRVAYLCGEVDDDLAARLVLGLRRLAVRDGEITLLITSGGGGMMAAYAIADAIRDARVPVTGKVTGECCSAAIFPLFACETRLATRDSVLMIHGLQEFLDGDTSHHEAAIGINNKLIVEQARLFGSRTNKPAEYWLPLLKSSLPNYYTGQEALEMGLVDGLV